MDENKIYFTKIPNSLFYTYIDKKNNKEIKSFFPLIKDEKVILVLDYFYMNTTRKNTIKFTLEDIIVENGFKPNASKNRVNNQFQRIIVRLQELKIICCNVDLNTIKPKDLVTCTLEINLDNSFTVLYDSEKNLLRNQNLIKTDNVKVLYYYCYLKSRMYKRAKDDELSKNGGRAEITFVDYDQINKDIGITDETIKKYNDLLIELNLIRIGNAGLWYYSDDKEKIRRESPNIYTLFTGDEEQAEINIKEGIKYYKSLEINSNKVFTDSRVYKNNNKKLNGELGSIIKKENKGTATKEDINRKNEILASINADNEQFKIKALLSSGDGKLLSSIYEDLNKNEIANRYFTLESSLGLIDDIGNLLVGYDYYSWVMVNYIEESHSFYFNSIRKHKKNKRSEIQSYNLESYYNNPFNSEELEYKIQEITDRLNFGEDPDEFNREEKFIYDNYINVSDGLEDLM